MFYNIILNLYYFIIIVFYLTGDLYPIQLFSLAATKFYFYYNYNYDIIYI